MKQNNRKRFLYFNALKKALEYYKEDNHIKAGEWLAKASNFSSVLNQTFGVREENNFVQKLSSFMQKNKTEDELKEFMKQAPIPLKTCHKFGVVAIVVDLEELTLERFEVKVRPRSIWLYKRIEFGDKNFKKFYRSVPIDCLKLVDEYPALYAHLEKHKPFLDIVG